MFFDGKGTSTKSIRLGGASVNKRQERNAVLERAREQRAKRADDRSRSQASVKLQAFIRQKAQVHRTRCSERATWDSHMAQMQLVKQQLEGAGINFPGAPVIVLQNLLRQINFFYHPSCDRQRLARMCAMLLASFQSEDPQRNIGSMAHSPVESFVFPSSGRKVLQSDIWFCQIKSVCVKCLHQIKGAAQVGGGEDGEDKELVQLLLCCTDSVKLKSEHVSLKLLHEISKLSIQQNCGFFTVLRQFVLQLQSPTVGCTLDETMLADFVEVCWAVLGFRRDKSSALVPVSLQSIEGGGSSSDWIQGQLLNAYQDFAVSVLTLPALVSKKSQTAPNLQSKILLPFIAADKRLAKSDPVFQSSWRLLLAALQRMLSGVAGRVELGEEASAALLGNILQLEAASDVAGGDELLAMELAAVVSPLVRLLPVPVFAPHQHSGSRGTTSGHAESVLDFDDDDDETEATTVESILRRLNRNRQGRLSRPPHPEVIEQLWLLVDQRLITSLFHAASKASGKQDAVGSAEDPMEVDGGGSNQGGSNPFSLGRGRNWWATGSHVDDSDGVLLVSKIYGTILYRAAAAEGCASFGLSTSGAAGGTSWGLAVLEAIAYSVKPLPIVRVLWTQLAPMMEGGSGQACSIFTKDKQDHPDHPSPDLVEYHTALLLFIYSYSHLLLTSDDSEVFDNPLDGAQKRHPLEVGMLPGLVKWLKMVLYQMMWLEQRLFSSPHQEREFEPLLLLFRATRLFNQLYDRNCRRAFCSPGQWLWPSHASFSDVTNSAGAKADAERARVSRVLSIIPQVVSFDHRVARFQRLLEADRIEVQGEVRGPGMGTRIRVRREFIVQDSLSGFTAMKDNLKRRVQITFVNEQGLEEAGIDGGGLLKEYMDTLTKAAFDPEVGLFSATADQLLYPNPTSHMMHGSEEHHAQFKFLGQVLGKAMYDGILVEPRFAKFFLNKLLGHYPSFDDLHSLDPELYRHLTFLKKYEGEIADLCLTFEVASNAYGQSSSQELIPGGANIDVSNSNLIRYLHHVADYKLNRQIAQQSAAFLEGFRDLIPLKWLRMFSPQELHNLISGSSQTVDLVDLKRNMTYAGGYHESQPCMHWFWEVLEEFNDEQRGNFLKFVTSCSRQPLLGFRQLNPPFCIQAVRVESDSERLPSASTCMNLLKLPTFSCKEALREKLLYSISSNAGFELS
jgi:hypothetical protein